MARILVQFSHPALEKSRLHVIMLKHIQKLQGITINDLYQQYPYFDIDVKREQELLLAHDVIIFQHPFYWYSSPAIIKQWQDLVLEHGWAYGQKGIMLQGKKTFNVITAGGSTDSYQKDGYNAYSVHEFFRPVERTAKLCNMEYWPPYVIHGTHLMNTTDINKEALRYADFLAALRDDRISTQSAVSVNYLNELALNSQSR